MAPPKIYKSGICDYHLYINADYKKDFDDLCHKKGKSRNQYLNDLIIRELEHEAITDNDMLAGETISCLGYTPKPVQQKIDEIAQIEKESFRLPTEDELIDHLESLKTPQQIGRLQGQYSKGYDKCKTRMNQIKIANLRI